MSKETLVSDAFDGMLAIRPRRQMQFRRAVLASRSQQFTRAVDVFRDAVVEVEIDIKVTLLVRLAFVLAAAMLSN